MGFLNTGPNFLRHLRYILLIDIESYGEKVCQNGTLEAALDDPAGPPFPLRLPTVVPPNGNRELKCAILAQLGVFTGLEGHWEAGGGRGAAEESI